MSKPDCLDCGHCESCIERSVAAAEEAMSVDDIYAAAERLMACRESPSIVYDVVIFTKESLAASGIEDAESDPTGGCRFTGIPVYVEENDAAAAIKATELVGVYGKRVLMVKDDGSVFKIEAKSTDD